MPIIQINIKDKVASLVSNTDYIVSHNSDYVFEFTFDAEWSEYATKTARIESGGEYVDVPFVGNMCTVPILGKGSLVRVGVFAGELHTTTAATIKLVPSVLTDNGTPMPPSPDVYSQIIRKLDEIRDGSSPFSLHKIGDYKYEASFGVIDYDFAYEHFRNAEPSVPAGACSSVRSGNLYGRNLDWKYDDGASFIVRVPAQGKRYASIGVAGAITGLTMEYVDSHDTSELYKLIPFYTQDGINECGLICNTNVVPNDYGNNVSVPTGEQTDSVNGIMLVRYILDHFKTAAEAVTYIAEHVSVWFSDKLHQMGYEQHYMVADSEKTYCLEFVDNAAVAIDITDRPYMTNFHLHNIEPNADGKVYTPADVDAGNGDPIADNRLTEHASGLERYNLIADEYSGINSAVAMRGLLNNLTYTRTYASSEDCAEPRWFTEFVGGDLWCNAHTEAFAEIDAAAATHYTNRTRHDAPEDATWQTVHSVIYNMLTKSMTIVWQEDGFEHSFALGMNNNVWDLYLSLDERIKALEERE